MYKCVLGNVLPYQWKPILSPRVKPQHFFIFSVLFCLSLVHNKKRHKSLVVSCLSRGAISRSESHKCHCKIITWSKHTQVRVECFHSFFFYCHSFCFLHIQSLSLTPTSSLPVLPLRFSLVLSIDLVISQITVLVIYTHTGGGGGGLACI